MSSLIRSKAHPKAHRLQGSSPARLIGCGRQASIELFRCSPVFGGGGRPSGIAATAAFDVAAFDVEGSRDQNGISSSMSLLRAPAATARRGAALDGPPDPKSRPDESSDPKLPPPPPPRPSSMVSVELKFCSTTSVEYFSTPLWSVHLRVCNWPSI